VIFISLYVFGAAIEYAQEYSNRYFHKKIHGRYDIEDIQANLKGLVLFSFLWILVVVILFVYQKFKFVKVDDSQDRPKEDRGSHRFGTNNIKKYNINCTTFAGQ